MHKKRILRVTLFVAIAALLSAAILYLPLRAILFNLTGEESIVRQLYGLAQLALNWTRPQPRLAADTAIAYTDLPPFGVNTFLEQEAEIAKREASLQMIAGAGFAWIRQSFPWYDIEIHGKGDFEDRRHEPHRSAWEKYDNIVELAERYDLAIIARLEQPPAWSRADGTAGGEFGPPDEFEDFADYVSAVVARYRGRIRFYQIWNEPNIYPEWGHQPVDPAAYTELLCLAYEHIKETDPEAVVISGAMAPTIELGTWNVADQGNNLMDIIFLQRMYDAGAGACFDIMAVNDYMLWSGPTDRRLSQGVVTFSRPLLVRDVMVANGDAAKPIWISEMNSNAAPEPVPSRFGRVTLEQQAKYAPLAYKRIQREWPWAGISTMWFFRRKDASEIEQPFYYFRMVEPDFTPMPVYNSLAEYIKSLAPALYRGRHQEASWQISYSGEWRDIPGDSPAGGLRQAEAAGASAAIVWEGRTLTLVPGPGEGRIPVTDSAGRARELELDGEPVVLARRLWQRQAALTVTALSGVVSIDELWVR